MKKIYLFLTAFIACVFLFTGCKKEEFVVTFNPNGGQGAFITQTFTQKVTQPLMVNSFTKSGYAFTGWNTIADGTGTSYKDQEIVQISGHLVLYAQWKLLSGVFTVTFNANGGIGQMDPQKFEIGTSQSLSANRFYREDHNFYCWSTSIDGSDEKFINQQKISVSANMTLFAQWTTPTGTLKYFVHFDANGGGGTMESQEFTAGVAQKLAANTFVDSVFIFTGWNTRSNGSGAFYRDTEEISIYENMRLFALWMHPDSIK